MPYSIKTKDGIQINNIPDDVEPDSQQIKDRVQTERSKLGVQVPKVGQMSPRTGAVQGGQSYATTEAPPKDPEALSRANAADELGGSEGIWAGYLSANDKERATMIESWGIPVQEQGGFYFAQMPDGSERVINKPGLSGADVRGAVTDIITSFPAGKFASAGKGALAKFGRGIVAGGATGATREGVQSAAGGTFDPVDILIESALTGASEIAMPVIKGVINKLSPAARSKANNVKSIQELIDSGVDIDEIRSALKASDEYKTLTGKSAMPGEVMPGLQSEKLAAAAAQDMRKAKQISNIIAERTGAAHDKGKRLFADLSSKGPLDAANVGKKAAQSSLHKRKEAVRRVSNLMYEKAWDNGKDIHLDGTIAEFTRKATERTVPEIKDKILSQVKNLKGKMRPEELQEVIWDIRDELAKKGESSVKSQSRKHLKELEQSLVNKMDASTGGLYSKADSRYAEIKKNFIDRFIKSSSGQLADAEPEMYSQIYKSIFEPDSISLPLSKKFKDSMMSENPQAYSDMYASYFSDKLDNIADVKPSKISKALFGESVNSRKAIMELAPDDATRKRLADLDTILQAGKSIERISEDTAIKKWIGGQLDPDAAHFVYIRLAISRALKGSRDKKLAQAWFDVSTNPKWAKEWRELLETKEVMSRAKRASAKDRWEAAKNLEERSKALMERVVQNIAAGSVIEAAFPGAAMGAVHANQNSSQ